MSEQLSMDVPEAKLTVKDMTEVLKKYDCTDGISKGVAKWERKNDFAVTVTVEGGGVTSVFDVDLQTTQVALNTSESGDHDETLFGSSDYNDPDIRPLHAPEKVHEMRMGYLQKALRIVDEDVNDSLIEEM